MQKAKAIVRNSLKKYNTLSIVAKASLWAFISCFVQKASSVIATPIFTRLLTTDEYAQYTLYKSWQDIFRIFITLNVFNYSTYTAMIKYEDDKDGFISSAQTLVTGLTFAGMGLYYIIQKLAGEIIGFPLFIMELMFFELIFFSSYNLWFQRKRFDFQYKAITAVSFFIGIMSPVLGCIGVMIYKNRGYGRIYGTVAVHISVGFVLYIYNIYKSKKFISIKYWKYIFSFCVPLIPHFLSSQILSKFDGIMIDKMCSTSDVAIYSLSYSVSSLMIIVNDAILSAFTPYTYQCIKNEKKEGIKKKTILMLLVVASANLLLILFAPEAIKFFAPTEYYEAVYIIPAVSASVYFMFLFNVFANIEYYYSETKFVALASIGAAVSNVVLNYVFINLFGYIAAGYTTLASYIFYSVGHYIFMRKVEKKYADSYQFYDIRKIIIISVIFVVVALSIIPLYRYTLIRYILLISLIGFLYIDRKSITEMLHRNT